MQIVKKIILITEKHLFGLFFVVFHDNDLVNSYLILALPYMLLKLSTIHCYFAGEERPITAVWDVEKRLTANTDLTR